MLDAARKNFDAALATRAIAEEAAFKLFYDGILQISRVVVLLNGYRPDDGEQHKTTFYAAGEILGPEYEELIKKMQKFRVKRNACIYDPTELIGKSETDAIHKTARKFWSMGSCPLPVMSPNFRLFFWKWQAGQCGTALPQFRQQFRRSQDSYAAKALQAKQVMIPGDDVIGLTLHGALQNTIVGLIVEDP